jgi:ADP-ribosylglycohydrolase
MSTETRQDKILGGLLCHLVGDCLGAPYEFNHHINTRYTDEYTSANRPTDDSYMAFALIDCLLKNWVSGPEPGSGPVWDRDSVIKAYNAFAGSDLPDIGYTTVSLFRHPPFRAIQAYTAMFNEMFIRKPIDKWSQSNGSLMRAFPLCVFPRHLMIWRQDTALSNPHMVSIEASDVYFRMIHNVLDATQEKLTVDWAVTPMVKQCIQDALDMTTLQATSTRDVSKNRGWVLHALYFACIAYNLRVTDPREWFKFVVGKHCAPVTFSDTDTNACISGAIVGLNAGAQKLYKSEWFKDFVDNVVQAEIQHKRQVNAGCIKEFMKKIN